MVGNDLPHHGLVRLLQACALLAERLATCTRSNVLTFDVVAGIAVAVVVVNGLLDRVPRIFLCHVGSPN